MTEKPNRFRFSLITLVVAVNVAGVLVWANVRGRTGMPEDFRSDWSYLSDRFARDGAPKHTVRGWPRPAYYDTDFGARDAERGKFMSEGVAFNGFFAIMLLVTLGGLTELLVCKLRKAKRHDG